MYLFIYSPTYRLRRIYSHCDRLHAYEHLFSFIHLNVLVLVTEISVCLCVCVWECVYKALMLRLNEFLIALFTIEFFRYKLFILPKILNPLSLEKARAVFCSYLQTWFFIVFALVWLWMLLSLRGFNIFLLCCSAVVI